MLCGPILCFLPPEQTAARFVVDHLAVMGLFARAAHYGGVGLRRFQAERGKHDDQQSTDCRRACMRWCSPAAGRGKRTVRQRNKRSGHGNSLPQTPLSRQLWTTRVWQLWPPALSCGYGLLERGTLGDLRVDLYSLIDLARPLRCQHPEGAGPGRETFFYDIYTDEEKAADPEWRYRAVFFRGSPGPVCSMQCGRGFCLCGCHARQLPPCYGMSRQGYNAFA
jgi:hypothetical protein